MNIIENIKISEMENMVHENMTSLLNVLPNATNTTSLRGQAFHNPLGDQPGLQYFFMVCMGMLSVFGTLGNLMVSHVIVMRLPPVCDKKVAYSLSGDPGGLRHARTSYHFQLLYRQFSVR